MGLGGAAAHTDPSSLYIYAFTRLKLRSVYSDATQLNSTSSCVAINGPYNDVPYSDSDM